ncbi:MAG: hypothetical protein ACREUE_20385, partial [Panacagrimonas sp.]
MSFIFISNSSGCSVRRSVFVATVVKGRIQRLRRTHTEISDLADTLRLDGAVRLKGVAIRRHALRVGLALHWDHPSMR